MFNSNNRRSSESTTPSLPAAPAQSSNKRGMFSVIGQDVTITGSVSATADLHIDGRIEGDVNCGSLVQGSESRITGNVRAETARLAGSIEGTVSVRQLTVEKAARITGDVEYENIAIENGAAIDGRLKHLGADAGRSFQQSPAVAPLRAPTPPVANSPTPDYSAHSQAAE